MRRFYALVSSRAIVVALAIDWPTSALAPRQRHQQRHAVATLVVRQHGAVGRGRLVDDRAAGDRGPGHRPPGMTWQAAKRQR